jgi:GNAT superfamily N-acetyltransferase
MSTQWTRGEFTVSTDPDRIDVDLAHRFLTESYWAEGIPREVVERSIRGALSFGLYYGEQMVGLARVITDRATFAYLSDVFVIEAYRGRGLATWMIEVVHAHPELQGLRWWLLATRDAHALYRQLGYSALDSPEKLLERKFKNVYRGGSDR